MDILTNKGAYAIMGEDAGSTANSFRVTDLKQAAHSENRINVFLDNKFAFSLDLAQVVDFKIKVGKRFSSDEVENFRRASEFGLLYQRTLEWVLMRPRSIHETREHLRLRQSRRNLDNKVRAKNATKPVEVRRDFKLPTRQLPPIQSEDIEAVIDRLVEKGYLDDAKFARYFVENRNQTKGISELRLRQELVKKGVPHSLIDQALAEAPRDQAAEIQKIIAKKRSRYDDKQLTAYLLRHGFPYDLIQTMLQ